MPREEVLQRNMRVWRITQILRRDELVHGGLKQRAPFWCECAREHGAVHKKHGAGAPVSVDVINFWGVGTRAGELVTSKSSYRLLPNLRNMFLSLAEVFEVVR